jgi:hypothetical protein
MVIPNPDLETETHFQSGHCEHLQGARVVSTFSSLAMTISKSEFGVIVVIHHALHPPFVRVSSPS